MSSTVGVERESVWTPYSGSSSCPIGNVPYSGHAPDVRTLPEQMVLGNALDIVSKRVVLPRRAATCLWYGSYAPT